MTTSQSNQMKYTMANNGFTTVVIQLKWHQRNCHQSFLRSHIHRSQQRKRVNYDYGPSLIIENPEKLS